jgi:hypothetical protein
MASISKARRVSIGLTWSYDIEDNSTRHA